MSMKYMNKSIKELHELLVAKKVTAKQLTEEAIELAKSNTNNLLEATNYEQALKEAEAITEVKEELGIDISKYDITEFDSGCDGKDCYKMYYVKADLDIADLNIQKEELTLVKYFSMQELEEMVENKTLNQDQVDFFIKCKEFIEKNKKI